MQKGELPARNAGAMIIFLAIGSNMILSLPGGVKQDTWISLLLSYAIAIPVLLIYARLIKLMPGRDIFQIAEAALGKAAGKLLGGVFTLFCLLVAAVTLHIYSEFIHLTLLYNTPLIISMALIMPVCLYIAKSGVETLGKWCLIIFILFVAASVLLDILSAQYFDPGNLMPVMNHSPEEMGAAAVMLSSVSLGDSVIALALIAGFSGNRNGTRPHRLFLVWAAAASLILILNFVRDCGSIGVNSLDTVYMPAYKFAGQIRTGTLLDRIEPLAAIILIQVGISKISACYMAANRGAASIFGCKPRGIMVFPMCLLIIAVSALAFKNVPQLLDFMDEYYLYAAPFQLVLPVIIWVAAEIRAFAKRRRARSSGRGSESPA